MMTILYVQDDDAQAAGDVNGLTNFGGARFYVEMAGTVEEAQQLLEKRTFDLLLVDYHLGEGKLRGLRLLDAMPADAGATRVLFSAHTKAEVLQDWARPWPSGVQFWEKGSLWTRLRAWLHEKTRTCTLGTSGRCLWSTLPDTVKLPTEPFYYVAFPYELDVVNLEESWYRDTLEQSVEPSVRAPVEITLRATHRDSLDHCLHAIRRSLVVIADLRRERPTVMMEIGFAVAMNRPLLLLIPKEQFLPHYLQRHAALPYNTPTPREDGRLLNRINVWLKDREPVSHLLR